MITNPEENNIKLTSEQTQAIEETKSRLMNLEVEISIANKNLKALKSDTERITKEKIYQEELLAKVNTQIDDANSRLTSLLGAVLTGTNALSEVNQEIGKKGDILKAMELEFKSREDTLSSKEADLVTRETSVALREEDVKKLGAILQDKHAKIKDFAETI